MAANSGLGGVDVSEEVRRSWGAIADWWDAQVGEGNPMQRTLLWPSAERLLEWRPGHRVLEIACGNGSFARRLAGLGCSVLAVDFTERFLELARQRTDPGASRVEYRKLDATSSTELEGLGPGSFDSIACMMALMDMSDVAPLMRAVPRLLRPGGRFVFAVLHPCFNGSGTTRMLSETDTGEALHETRSVRVSEYATSRTTRGIGIPGQPQPHLYFDRPLSGIFGAAFEAGLVMDALEEPVFTEPVEGSRPLSWTRFPEIPPAIVARMRPG